MNVTVLNRCIRTFVGIRFLGTALPQSYIRFRGVALNATGKSLCETDDRRTDWGESLLMWRSNLEDLRKRYALLTLSLFPNEVGRHSGSSDIRFPVSSNCISQLITENFASKFSGLWRLVVYEDGDLWPYVRDTRVQILVNGSCSSAYRKQSRLVFSLV